MSKNKKAISPLISWILLIGFAVAMATVVINWSIEQVNKVDFYKQTIKENCANVDLEITGACRNNYNVSGVGLGESIVVRVKNAGYFDLPLATVGRSTSNIPESWCLDLDFNLSSGSNELVVKNYKINGTFLNTNFDSEFNQYTDCKALSGGTVNENLHSFTIVPWIRVEGQSVPCNEKRIIISEQNLVCNCSATDINNMTCPND